MACPVRRQGEAPTHPCTQLDIESGLTTEGVTTCTTGCGKMLSMSSYLDVGLGLRLRRRPPCPFPSHALTWLHSARQAKGNEQEISVGRGGQARRARDEAIAGGEEAAAGRADGRTEGGEDRQKAEEEEDKRKGKQEPKDEAQTDIDNNAAIHVPTLRAVHTSLVCVESLPGIQERQTTWTERAVVSGLKNMTRAAEESSELKLVAGRLGRKLCTRVGQVASSQSELGRLANAIHDILSLSLSHPTRVCPAFPSSFWRHLLPQAETGPSQAADGLPAETSRVAGGGEAPREAMGDLLDEPRTSDNEWRKMIGRELEGKSDPDDKPPTLETTSQYTDRMVGQLALYAAILQTSRCRLRLSLTRCLLRLDRQSYGRGLLCVSVVLEAAGEGLYEAYETQSSMRSQGPDVEGKAGGGVEVYGTSRAFARVSYSETRVVLYLHEEGAYVSNRGRVCIYELYDPSYLRVGLVGGIFSWFADGVNPYWLDTRD
ncbi:hypothetical protein RHS01_08193 [Rhizoctonia solani]|uniref:Uncharacterized protein n=1 Tax=Rhizoctonia solani TaxID=456999 RepID=A0A8H7M488_9AGAM|nr:hypothetical protein RHS01_08193 [Rhizoctonia solani]